MNRDQVSGTAKDIAGKVQQKVGEKTGDLGDQAKGLGRQIEGKVQKGVGNAEEALDRATDDDRASSNERNRSTTDR